MYTPVKKKVFCIQVGFKDIKIMYTCFRDGGNLLELADLNKSLTYWRVPFNSLFHAPKRIYKFNLLVL